MLKNLIVLPDGSEIFSGPGTENAIQSVVLTQQVNTGTELSLGSIGTAKLEATLFTPAGQLHIIPGQEIVLYKVDQTGSRTKVGHFVATKVLRPSANQYRITAYDATKGLEKDLRQWLESLDGWPYSLYDFAQMVCAACQLTLQNDSLPNGDWQIQKFSLRSITGVRLMQWIGQVCGRFCRATADGQLEFAWYTPKNVTVTPGGDVFYFADTLEEADYTVAPVDKVHLKLTEKDVGVTYGSGTNTYVLSGNYLLAAAAAEELLTVAKTAYETLGSATYVPCKLSVPATAQIQAGDIIMVVDCNGRNFPVYVMTKTNIGNIDTLQSVGSLLRDTERVSGQEHWNGRLMELEMDVDGLRLKNTDADGRLFSLEASVDGLSTKFTDQKTELDGALERISQMEQTADGLTLKVKSVTDDGVERVSTTAGYTFDENGLTVRKSGKEIQTQITEDGMTVYKNGNPVLTANSGGVEAVDLHASTYLIVAGKSRFEKYKSNRVGCFWIGG